MNKAFIFDMDGVLIDSESTWGPIEREFFPKLFGEEIAKQVGSSLGLSLHDFYANAVQFGVTISKEDFLNAYESQAALVYERSLITNDVEALAKHLIAHDFKLGLVSMSPMNWIEMTLGKLAFKDSFGVVISVNNNPILRGKPFPDGYIKAMEVLGASSKSTVILEDSNTGMRAAKDSGAHVIGFREHLPEHYKQLDLADDYADSMQDVIRLVEQFDSKITPR